MNICFLEGDMSRRGGTERMTAILANELCQRHRVWILSLHLADGQPFFPLDERVQHRTVLAGSGKLGMLRQIQEIHTFLRQEKIDCVINVDTGMGVYGILAAVGTDAKVITWEHSNFFNNWNSRTFPYLRRFAAKHSDTMVVLTERDRENYRTNIPSKTPVYVIHNPAARHEFRYDAESKVILSAGLLLPIKGYDKAVAAAAKVLPQRPDWKWIICGEGPEREHLEQLIAAAGLREQMLLPGSVSNMDEQYQKAAIFAMTSQMEGLPMVLLEAKSWGLPLVSFDIMTGPGEIIRDGVNGYLVEPDNVDEMAKRLAELMDNPVLREEFSARSQLDMEQFDIAHIVEQWESVLEGL